MAVKASGVAVVRANDRDPVNQRGEPNDAPRARATLPEAGSVSGGEGGLCAWCGTEPPVCFLFTVATCQSCLDGGRKHRVAVALKRWSKR